MSSSIVFATKEELNFEFQTKVSNANGIIKNIYKYNDLVDNCEKFFEASAKYIGFTKNNKFYIVNLLDDTFDDEFKNIFISNEKHMEIVSLPTINNKNEDEILESEEIVADILLNTPNFEYLELDKNKCPIIQNLDNAKRSILELNHKLNCIDYRISIDYVFQMENDTEINLYKFKQNATSITLLLCIYNSNNACISSLIIEYSEKSKSIFISSKTKIGYEGKKMNKLLRAIVIIIAKELFPEVRYIKSDAVNPTSAYLMINSFKGNAYTYDDEEFNLTTFEDIQRYMDDNNEGIDIIVEINDENIENANDIFNKVVGNCEFMKNVGGKRKSKSRGIKTKKNKYKTHKKYKLRGIKKKNNNQHS